LALTFPELLITRDTVIGATPARFATSRMLGILHLLAKMKPNKVGGSVGMVTLS
jgi:hypothetical protein